MSQPSDIGHRNESGRAGFHDSHGTKNNRKFGLSSSDPSTRPSGPVPETKRRNAENQRKRTGFLKALSALSRLALSYHILSISQKNQRQKRQKRQIQVTQVMQSLCAWSISPVVGTSLKRPGSQRFSALDRPYGRGYLDVTDWCNENLPESMDFHDFPMKYVDFPAFFRFHQFY